MDKVTKSAGTRKPPLKGGSRKGIPNKNTAAIKDMIVQALDEAGGVKYLVAQAKKNPKAFLTLIGRVLPLQITGEGGGPLRITVSQDDVEL